MKPAWSLSGALQCILLHALLQCGHASSSPAPSTTPSITHTQTKTVSQSYTPTLTVNSGQTAIGTISTDVVTCGQLAHGNWVAYAFTVPDAFANGFMVGIQPDSNGDADVLLFNSRSSLTACSANIAACDGTYPNYVGLIASADYPGPGVPVYANVTSSMFYGPGQVRTA